MKITPITQANAPIFEVFAQDYEAEFSAITQKEPDAEGRFALEADWKSPNSGFFLFIKKKPTGFAVKGTTVDGKSDMAEFYILPCYRKRGFGKMFAFALFDYFPGQWQVRQVLKATNAIAFWRTTISEYTKGNHTEDQITDPHWGKVIRQCFESKTQF